VKERWVGPIKERQKLLKSVTMKARLFQAAKLVETVEFKVVLMKAGEHG
jgi:hypothetical protein